MKRAIVLISISVLGLVSCTYVSLKTELKTDIDTVSFYFGMSRAEGFDHHLLEAGIDTVYMDAFLKGFKEGVKKYSPEDVAWLEGMRIAQAINNQWVRELNSVVFMDDPDHKINRKAILSGFYNGIKYSNDSERRLADAYSQIKIEQIQQEYRDEKFKSYKAKGEKFLAGNKNKEGVITTSSGLQYKILEKGSSNIIPNENSVVKINYIGRFMDDSEFDNTYRNEKPSTVQVNRIIQGWTEALTMMTVGSKWILYIPPELAYGAKEQKDIPPYSVLIFEIELLEVVSL